MYTRTIPCGENKGTDKDSRAISEEEWQNLKNSIDYDQFLALDYNECNLCADGCDEIIRITKPGETHTIRYDPEQNIGEVLQLQTYLRELMLEFKEEN